MIKSSSIEFEPLRTILNMERERGYSNTAVIGGLDRYLSKWATEFKDNVKSSTGIITGTRFSMN